MLLLLVIVLAAVILVTSGRVWSTAVVRRENNLLERLDIASRICEGVARSTCNIALDHTLESIPKLDELIEHNSTSDWQQDVQYVIGAYLGETLRSDADAKWKLEKGHSYPVLLLNANRFDPFDLVLRKISAPNSVSIDREIRMLLSPITDAHDPIQQIG